MEKRVKIVCGVVAVLGLLSAASAFAAKGTRIKGSDVVITASAPDQFVYPKSPALPLGITAALGLAHAIINGETGCGCYRHGPRPPGSKRTISYDFWKTMFYVILSCIQVTGGIPSMYITR